MVIRHLYAWKLFILACFLATFAQAQTVSFTSQTLGNNTPNCPNIWVCLESLANEETDLLVTSPAHLAKIIPEFSTLDLPYLFQSPEQATAALEPNTSIFNTFDTLIKDRLNATIVLVQISPLSVWNLTFRTKAPTYTLDDFEGHTFGTEWTNTTTADHLGLFSRQVSRMHLLELTTQIEDRNLSNVVALPDKVFTKRLIETGLAHVLDEQRHCRC